ncbi:MAG: hypothetical protein EOM54_10005 [Clostridia bacterium]|nr:hypothetical protein [Clostridia bacterium]
MYPISASNIIVELAIIIAVYSLPIIIFRYIILKRPIDKKKANIIITIYSAIGLLIVSALKSVISGTTAASVGLAMWSLVIYKMLTPGKYRRTNSDPETGYESKLYNVGSRRDSSPGLLMSMLSKSSRNAERGFSQNYESYDPASSQDRRVSSFDPEIKDPQNLQPFAVAIIIAVFIISAVLVFSAYVYDFLDIFGI